MEVARPFLLQPGNEARLWILHTTLWPYS